MRPILLKNIVWPFERGKDTYGYKEYRGKMLKKCMFTFLMYYDYPDFVAISIHKIQNKEEKRTNLTHIQ